MEERPRPHVPTPVRIIAWFEIIAGALGAVSGFVLIGRGGMLLLAFGLVAIAAGWGLLNARLWAYYVVLVLAGLNVVFALPLALRGTSTLLITLLINATIVLVLLGGESRQWAASLRRP